MAAQNAIEPPTAVLQPVDWGEWTPGDPEAAARLYSGHRGLQDLLDLKGIETIKSIATTRMNDLAAVIAQAVDEGWSADRLAGEIRGMLTIPSRAEMIATTEIARAISAASIERYRGAGIEWIEWDTGDDERVCPICAANEDGGPVRLGQQFPSGALYPPAHPWCRCSPQAVLDPPQPTNAIE